MQPAYPTKTKHRRRFIGALLLVLAALVCATVGSGSATDDAGAAVKPAKAKRPNILVIMSDDQTAESQKFMPIVNRRIGAKGATFRDSFVSNPLCCPSRATFLTGQYSQNNGVLDNSPPDGGYAGLDHTNTLATWLHDSGYYTSLLGKYLNGYEHTPQPQTIPPGWDNWQATTQTYLYYGYRFNENGRSVDYFDKPSDYQTDVLTQKAVHMIRDRAQTKKPWFTWLTYLAPHSGGPPHNPQPPADRCAGSAKPAPRDADAFLDVPLPMGPSFDEADVSDKPSFIADQASFTATDVSRIQRQRGCRLASLLALDDGVDRVMDTLKRTGQLDNTYVIYTSDNGWFEGQHRIADGKRRLYEPSIRVPLMIRGPQIKPGTTVKDLVINADLAPTITKLARAGGKVRRTYDGRALQTFIEHPDLQRGRQLLLSGTRKPGKAIRNRRYFYGRFETGEHEMYDLKLDPEELQNVYDDPAYADARAALERQFEKLIHCAGQRCKRGPGAKLSIARQAGPGKECARKPVAARVKDSEAPIDQVTFAIGSQPSTLDDEAPFEATLGPAAGASAKAVVHARVELVDGRLVTLRVKPRTCK